ncbi:helix-turn-helix transcriptional regulator [Silanimonas sp.]|jgi:transcriptional regulator with XRE-family HTH domain|uniref:helix-turn-helix domain-containing protein n=1 Tax=Silanimonas sp. TaxID=1929290 RepID=UPI0022CD18E1|nr:helix-turn-helix transcriptional regulator [Silanimonas sp.]MCZ8062791.1 helix-turn-helix transcriptional regulator [Silanimonas sp.]
MNADTLQRRVGASIRRRRESLGMSQEAFAAHIGMHRTYYSAIERGEKNISLSTIQRLCEALGAKAWEIFKEAEQ